MSKKVLVPIADGSEEIEAIGIIDTLRRAGADVTVASVGTSRNVTAARKTNLVADCLLSECTSSTFDAVLLPGGMPGAQHLHDCEPLIALLKHQAQSGRLYGAICASPAVVLQPHGLLDGKVATCHPAFAAKLANASRVDQRVVVDGNCVTSRAPGTSLEFALKVIELLFSEDKAKEVAAPMLVLNYPIVA
eukprot:CAMPEP_0196652882 /NCGR_PEP_ID=MMETSP1086-20130531/2339_1 /TAXON_ID=77921 /ORGANISM="Cyanoptyche  gloeocystis , Strain SAG4.97" /LENGTH=190 /DNA_ID=CAMNT_0041983701 /DNA_START=46 /DNA_END=618 /DNA_ORIENTATION=-